MSQFILSCESTVDLPYSYVNGRDIPVLFYTYSVNGVEYIDDMGRDPNALPSFYKILDGGTIPSTSQLNSAKYVDFFDEQLKKGDVLHVVFGSGMTQSIQNAEIAANLMREKYPDRKLVIVDSMCSSSGYGLLVDYAADMRDEGKSIEETESWLLANRQNIHHQFFSTRLDFYRKSGRMSGPAAMLGTILGICPIMRLDDKGTIIAYDKVRGKQGAVARTVDVMSKHAVNGLQYSGKCFICNSNCPEDAEKLRAAIAEKFPNISYDNIKICDIGTIIASHCGPGTVAVFFLGDKRLPK